MSFHDYNSEHCDVSVLEGKTFVRLEKTDEELIFWAENKADSYSLYHIQGCCECVYIEDVVGDLEDLENTPILKAEEVRSQTLPPVNDYDSSWTWTFYKFSTIKGSVTIRWYGTSNGYYSEEVTCCKWYDDPEEDL